MNLELNEQLATLAETLQDDLALIDALNNSSSGNDGPFMEMLVKKHRLLKLKMDRCENHGLPHIHIDYHRKHHVVSYSIETGKILAGAPIKGYENSITTWIGKYRAKLLTLWSAMRNEGDYEPIVAELQASPFG